METRFIPVNIALLTVSDTRIFDNDTSGKVLREGILTAGHQLSAQQIVPDDCYQIRAIISKWIADPNIDAIISTGGTGLTGRDGTPEAVQVLLDKEIAGFGDKLKPLLSNLAQ
jgi:molybdenum cofactor biosynthesis protein B